MSSRIDVRGKYLKEICNMMREGTLFWRKNYSLLAYDTPVGPLLFKEFKYCRWLNGHRESSCSRDRCKGKIAYMDENNILNVDCFGTDVGKSNILYIENPPILFLMDEDLCI